MLDGLPIELLVLLVAHLFGVRSGWTHGSLQPLCVVGRLIATKQRIHTSTPWPMSLEIQQTL